MLKIEECQKFTSGSWLIEPKRVDCLVDVVTDSRTVNEKSLFLAFEGEKFDAHDFLEDVLSKGILAVCVHKTPSQALLNLALEKSTAVLLVEDTVTAYQNLATGLLSLSECKVIGVTGSSGKTSVKAVLSQMLEAVAPGQVLSTIANTNNHIGVPQNILRLKAEHKYAVIEMGTNNPGEIATLAKCAPPDIAVITSIGDSHSGNFPREDGILYEKSDIVKHMKNDGMAIIPDHLKESIQSTGVLDAHDYKTFGSESSDSYVVYKSGSLDGAVLAFGDYELTCSLSGRHQAQNISACCLVMKELGFDFSEYKDVLPELQLPGMRMKVELLSEVTWVNDAYNANPQSMSAFITWLSEIPNLQEKYRKCHLVLGDMLELGDKSLSFHKAIVKQLPKDWTCVGVGENFFQLEDANFTAFEDSDKAAEALVQNVQKGDLVALKGSRGIKLETIIKKLTD
ncbi:MAG: UDP-N-acetylmuramoyl-tripeptide--D-alanyl-D-alanine ligase [Lentisphaeraceae bacterium]|nr:UDP-N-acetylmuramoyl-tripeptide--D-alanyl-D-alanine ligase [Lentisphaeraceae bacterium]